MVLCKVIVFLCVVSIVLSKTGAQNGIPEGAATLAFVFDTTGSMYDDLVQVRARASRILAESLKQSVKPLYNYALVPFHDPDVGPATITTDANLFQRHLDELYVQGGGDCPEMSITAIMLALEISLPGSFIYVFTDAQAKDLDVTEKVLKLIQQKQSQVIFILTGDCHNKTIDPGFATYKLIAATSNGQVFNLKKKDVNQVLRFVEESVRANKVNLLSIDIQEPSPRTFAIPIDSTLERVTVSLSGQDAKLVIRDPDGVIVTQATGLQILLSLKTAVSVAVRRPKAGIWNITVECSGGFTLRVTGLSPVSFVYGFSLTVVDQMRNLLKRPAAGFRNFAVVKVEGLASPGSVNRAQLLDLNGKILREVVFVSRLDDKFTFDWMDFVAPPGLFYIRILGRDSKGHVFQRCSVTAISAILPEAPKVTAADVREVLVGSPTTLVCQVRSEVPFRSQWSKSLQSLNAVSTGIGVVNVTHSILSASTASSGLYTCFASNVGGTGSATTRLVVKVPRPVIIQRDEVRLTVEGGDTIVLRCTTDNSFPSKIEWYKDGQRIQNSPHAQQWSNGSLFLDIRGRQDAGRYRCIAKSDVGQIARTTILSVNELPFVVIDTSTKNFQQGEEIQCACLVKGFPEPAVAWNKDGKRLTTNAAIEITDDHELKIKNAKPSDAGRYECVAWNSIGQSRAVVNLRHTVPPSVYVNKEEIIAREGDSVTLECRANGQPKPKIQWYKGRYAVLPSRRIATSSRGHLIINAVQRSDTGFYTCVALNIVGSDSITVSFSVQVPPRVTVERSEVYLTPGGSTSVQCLAVGIPPPVVNWYKNKLSLGPNGRVYANDAGELIIQNAVSGDAGTYECIARSVGGSTTVPVKVTIGGAPYISKSPKDKAVTIGENVTFHCGVQGAPIPKVSWRNTMGMIVLKKNPRYSVPFYGTLKIINVQVKDAGRYTCIAENEFGRIRASAVLILIGLSPPTITKDVKDSITAISGQSAKIPCSARGTPAPTITWTKDGFSIGQDDSRFMVTSDGSLVIKKVTSLDTGLYTCTAVNTAGSDTRTFSVFIQVPPRIISPPRDMVVKTGDVITLECVAGGFPLPRITWQLNNVTLSYNQSIISIYISGARNGGSYRCIASSTAGRDVATSTVAVISRPIIEHQDIDTYSANPGQSVSLPCRALGYPRPLITWLKNSVVVQISDVKYQQDPSGTLTITGVVPEDTGTYTCSAANIKGFDTLNITLIVKVSPKIVKPPRSKSVIEGQTLTLECVTKGFPVPKIQWKLNGTILPYNQSVLEIKNTMKNKHEGVYVCVAGNLDGRVEAGSRIRILSRVPPTESPTDDDTSAQGSRPVLTKIPEDAIVDAGSNLLWDCATTGNPTPTITWLRNSVQLRPPYPDRVTILSNNSLLIRNVKTEDEGIYQCHATSNSLIHAVQAILTVRVHGAWSEWGAWESCSHTCGTGTRFRYRRCDNPPSINGGRQCEGANIDRQLCNRNQCPIPGQWSYWGTWSRCSVVCGVGTQIRTRLCSNPPPQYGGDDCFGSNAESRLCNARKCTIEGEQSAVGRIKGVVNNVMLPNLVLQANITRRKSNITEVSCSINGLPGPMVNWFKYTVPITAPVYWAGSGGQPGSQNGLERTQGLFNFSTHIGYPNGEYLSIEYTGRGLNEQGALVMDVNVQGRTPNFPPNSKVSFQDYKDFYIQTGSGQISSTGTRFFNVNDKRFQYLCNNTVRYKPVVGRPPRSLSQTVEVMEVDVKEAPDQAALEIRMKTFVKRSPIPQECPQGLVKDVNGEFCIDMNECLFPDTCSHICENGFGTFRCLCRPGFYLLEDDKTCEDIDECSLPSTRCPSGQTCVNTQGNHSCQVDCGVGYSRSADGTCVDIDECRSYVSQPISNQHPCSHVCVNSPGSYTCSCKQGFELVNGKCQDIDECVNEICPHGCLNTEGGFECTCFPGYKVQDQTNCADVDECKLNKTLCGNKQCTNIEGSYKCLQSCRAGYKRTLDGKCIDLDECTEGGHDCLSNQLCMNTIGSFKCMCPRGYKYADSQRRCQDLNECESFPGICQYKCVNTIGSFKCVCPTGVILNSDGQTCSGVDGCLLNNLRCAQRCMSSPAGHRCSCSKGYRLHQDRQGCVDVNECLSNQTNSCQHECVNTIGSYRCRCPLGYKLSTDGKKCEDIDECSQGQSVCQQPNSRCFNTHGSYRCVQTQCPSNYNVLGPGYCLNSCNIPGYCAKQALRYYTVTLPLGVPANQDLLHLIPYYPVPLNTNQYICDFQYFFPTRSTPFGIRKTGNQAIIYTTVPLTTPGLHQLHVRANVKNADGTSAYQTDFTVYIDVARLEGLMAAWNFTHEEEEGFIMEEIFNRQSTNACNKNALDTLRRNIPVILCSLRSV